jgi:molecular chaperone HtpG
MSDPATGPERHEFKAEVAALLRLVTNSLYTNREIFLRELISNAADALDKARYLALVEPELRDQQAPARIEITIDRARGVLSVDDTGVGMTAEEATQNLGTIAHSGTLAFLEQARGQGGTTETASRPDLDLIGQFGVGFYSAFMVSDRIDVITCSARPGEDAVRWSSRGDGGFTVEPAGRTGRGTRVELHLRADAKDLLEPHRVEAIVRRYSNFVLHPVELRVLDADGNEEGEPRRVNATSAFWTRSAKDVSDAEYADFYRHVMGGFVLPGDEPFARLHVTMDAPIQFKALLYVPGRRPADLFGEDAKGLQLYARRVLVMESCDKLLPAYLRFVRGVVDSEDLPLNVSRELLQEHSSLAAIRRQLGRKVLKLLADTAAEDPERYAKIWEEFGPFVKEGLHTDNAHKDDIVALLRFRCTGREGLISLADYVAAMPEGQSAIYYVTGESAETLADSPHLEACRARGYGVLLMTDAVDEWVVQDLGEFSGKPLRSVTQGDLDLAEAKDGDHSQDAAAIAGLLELARTTLADRVKDVRASARLTSSAACLVDAEGGLPRNMERILRMANRPVPMAKRVLELNPQHPFVRAAQRLVAEGSDAERLRQYIELLHDQAHLAEGSVPDPAATVRRIQALLDAAVGVTEAPA